VSPELESEVDYVSLVTSSSDQMAIESDLVSRSSSGAPSLSTCPRFQVVLLVVSTCSKIVHGDCEYSHYYRVVEWTFLDEEASSKVAGI